MRRPRFVPAVIWGRAQQAKGRLSPRPDPLRRWIEGGCASPAPNSVKWRVLMRYGRPRDVWVETGTYLGETTAFLARSARHVYSIEPQQELARSAAHQFRDWTNITILEGLSEDLLPGLLLEINGPLSLWLDGHYSAGVTFRGPSETPIAQELEAVQTALPRFPRLSVFVDDVRCFDPQLSEYSMYPPRSWLVEWADRNGLSWTIEHDIFVAYR